MIENMPECWEHIYVSALKEDREPWRLERLRNLLFAADKAAESDVRRFQLRHALIRVRDEKGELQVLWDGAYFDIAFVALMRDAWRELGEFQPLQNLVAYF